MHYVMESDVRAAHAKVVDWPDLNPRDMKLGRTLGSPPSGPLEFCLDSGPPRPILPLYESGIPLMAIALADCLLSAGAENIELFKAVLHDPRSGRSQSSHVAFNILGLVDAADVDASVLMFEPVGSAAIDMDFESLVLDHDRIPSDLLLFRLAVAGRPIVVHETVRQAIECAGINGLRFCGDGEWMG